MRVLVLVLVALCLTPFVAAHPAQNNQTLGGEVQHNAEEFWRQLCYWLIGTCICLSIVCAYMKGKIDGASSYRGHMFDTYWFDYGTGCWIRHGSGLDYNANVFVPGEAEHHIQDRGAAHGDVVSSAVVVGLGWLLVIAFWTAMLTGRLLLYVLSPSRQPCTTVSAPPAQSATLLKAAPGVGRPPGLSFTFLDISTDLRTEVEDHDDDNDDDENASSDSVDHIFTASVVKCTTIDEIIDARNAARRAQQDIYDATFEPPGLFD